SPPSGASPRTIAARATTTSRLPVRRTSGRKRRSGWSTRRRSATSSPRRRPGRRARVRRRIVLPPRVRRALRRALSRGDRLEAEIDEEIRFHLTTRIERLMARGFSREAAEAEAVRRFGALADARSALLAAARQRE